MSGQENVTFDTIVDYVILIAFIMKKCGNTKTDIRQFVREFSNLCEELRNEVPIRVYSKIILTDTRNKLRKFNDFI